MTRLLSALVLGLLLGACTGEIRSTTTKRASEEQLYICTAQEQSVARLQFGSMKGRRVFVDESLLVCVDKNYAVSLVREQLMIAGAKVTGTPATADCILELRSGGVGTYARDNTIGIPRPIPPGSSASYTSPSDIPILVSIGISLREGWANIQAFAYEASDRRYVMGARENFGWSYQGIISDNIYPKEGLGSKLANEIR